MYIYIKPYIHISCISTCDPKNRKSLDKNAVICYGHVLTLLPFQICAKTENRHQQPKVILTFIN